MSELKYKKYVKRDAIKENKWVVRNFFKSGP
jgi:hypothetical protein